MMLRVFAVVAALAAIVHILSARVPVGLGATMPAAVMVLGAELAIIAVMTAVIVRALRGVPRPVPVRRAP